MKKIIVFFFFVALLAGCHEARTPEPAPPFVGKVSAVIDGKPYETRDLLLISHFPETKSISFGIIRGENEGLYFSLNNLEATLLKAVPYHHTDFDHSFLLICNKDKASYRTQKGQYLVQSREGNHIKASFWAELSDPQTNKTIVIEGGTIDIILPDRRYLRE